MWTRSISMYDSSSETPESRSVAAVSDDDNFRFSSWRQFIILFSCFQCFCCKVSPVNAWWWSGSLWFPTYNALQPKNEDNMSAGQGVGFNFLDFHLILFFCGNLTQATWIAITCSISLAYLCLSSVFLLSSCSRCSIVLLSSSIIRSSESFLWTRTWFRGHDGQVFYNCFW